MRINKCDICGCETDDTWAIIEQYQSNDIVDLCRKCNDKAAIEVSRIQAEVNDQMAEQVKSYLRSMVVK